MIGQNALLETRLARKVPRFVSIYVMAAKPGMQGPYSNPERAGDVGLMPAILVYPGDVIDTLDLRCVMGMLVTLQGDVGWPRLVDMFDRLMDFNPKRVVLTGTRSGKRVLIDWTTEYFNEWTEE